jgi:non-ribosomal peptide synthase protein (TIGR01720 family)
VSWRIILEDLQTACNQLLENQSIELPGRSWSYQRWANQLLSHVGSGACDTELEYWVEQQRASSLPLDFERGPNGVSSAASVSVALSAEQTHCLLQETARAYNTEPQDLMLLALAQAVGAWSNSARVSFWLEGHGRVELFEKQNLTRSVGWFTTLYPVGLEILDEETAEQIKSAKEQLRAVPNAGVGYGLLRYLHPRKEVRQQLAKASTELVFNYLGQLDNMKQDESLLQLSDEPTGMDQNEQAERDSLLVLNAAVLDGQLHVEWGFSENLHARETILKLAQAFIESLSALIEHCMSPDAGGYTPSDFPLANVDQATLDRLLGGSRTRTGDN